MATSSAADLAAAAELLGLPVQDGRYEAVNVIRSWAIPSESNPRLAYSVEERPDTVYGGTYLFCPCPGWKFQKGKGVDCKHVMYVKANIAQESRV